MADSMIIYRSLLNEALDKARNLKETDNPIRIGTDGYGSAVRSVWIMPDGLLGGMVILEIAADGMITAKRAFRIVEDIFVEKDQKIDGYEL